MSPAHLSEISQSWAYSLAQDRDGAMWLSTNVGVFRYNGHTLEKVLGYGEKGHMVAGDGFVWVKTAGRLAAIDLSDRTSRLWSFGKRDGKPVSAQLAEGDSLIVGAGPALYVLGGTAEEPRPMPFPAGNSELVCALHRTAAGRLLIGTEQGVVSPDGGFRIETRDPVLAIADAPEGGRLLLGLKSGGLWVADAGDGRILERYPACDGKPLLNVRSFAAAKGGCVYVGSASGLFKRDPSGRLSEILLNGNTATPVYEVFRDKDGNIWVGTCYSGVFYANLSTYHFRAVPQPVTNGPVRGFAEDARGVVWAATDAFGMHRYINGKWVLVDGSYGIKHQCILYDPAADAVYAGDWSGNLLRYARNGKIDTAGRLEPASAGDVEQYVLSMGRRGNDLVLGTLDGAFLFDPAGEKLITRKIEGTQGKVRAIAVGPDRRIWLAGNGVSCYDGNTLRPVLAPGETMVHDLEFSADGTLWCATERGLVGIIDDQVRAYDGAGSSILGQSMNYVMPFGDHLVAAGTKKGLVFLDLKDGAARMFDQESGLSFRSTMSSATLQLSDGTIWFGGIGGIESLDPAQAAFPAESAPLRLDGLRVGGTRVPPGTCLFNHTQTNFSFDLADYDFTEIRGTEYVGKLEGFEADWRPVDIRIPVEYMNLRPGRYTFRVRPVLSPEDGADGLSFPFRIKPVWYASVQFILLEVLLLLAFLTYIIRNRYTKAVLREKLRLQEEENRKQTSFFINLSFKMRTPLNLVIGQLEQYFKEYGARGRGVEDIQDIYGKAKGLRAIISEYVDTQNEALEREPRHAKTVNAVLGVVERNLFTKELNVSLLCDELNMGKTKLTAVMKEATGMSPGEYIEDVRLRHAAQMLESGNYTVTEVADKLGFSSASYFSVRFKGKFGVPPGRYPKRT